MISLFILDFSSVRFRGHSRLISNGSGDSTFALYNYSNLTFEDNSNVTIESAAVENASNSPNTIIYLQDHSSVAFKGNSTIIFGRNAVVEGIIYSQLYGNIIFDENSSVLFTLNLHLQGYTIYLKDHSKATYKGNSKAMFSNNIFEFQEGQTLYVYITILLLHLKRTLKYHSFITRFIMEMGELYIVNFIPPSCSLDIQL